MLLSANPVFTQTVRRKSAASPTENGSEWSHDFTCREATNKALVLGNDRFKHSIQDKLKRRVAPVTKRPEIGNQNKLRPH